MHGTADALRAMAPLLVTVLRQTVTVYRPQDVRPLVTTPQAAHVARVLDGVGPPAHRAAVCQFAYTALGTLARRVPAAFRNTMGVGLLRHFMIETLGVTADASLRSCCLEALAMLATAFTPGESLPASGPPITADLQAQLDAIMVAALNSSRPQSRFAAVRWAVRTCPYTHLPARLVCVAAAADPDAPEARAEALQGGVQPAGFPMSASSFSAATSLRHATGSVPQPAASFSDALLFFAPYAATALEATGHRGAVLSAKGALLPMALHQRSFGMLVHFLRVCIHLGHHHRRDSGSAHDLFAEAFNVTVPLVPADAVRCYVALAVGALEASNAAEHDMHMLSPATQQILRGALAEGAAALDELVASGACPSSLLPEAAAAVPLDSIRRALASPLATNGARSALARVLAARILRAPSTDPKKQPAQVSKRPTTGCSRLTAFKLHRSFTRLSLWCARRPADHHTSSCKPSFSCWATLLLHRRKAATLVPT